MNSKESYPHFRSTGATCLKIQQSPAQWAPLAINLGDYIHMTTQCQLVLRIRMHMWICALPQTRYAEI